MKVGIVMKTKIVGYIKRMKISGRTSFKEIKLRKQIGKLGKTLGYENFRLKTRTSFYVSAHGRSAEITKNPQPSLSKNGNRG